METALFFAHHIDNPCDDYSGGDRRAFCIRQARIILETMQDPNAKKVLIDKIKEYQDND